MLAHHSAPPMPCCTPFWSAVITGMGGKGSCHSPLRLWWLSQAGKWQWWLFCFFGPFDHLETPSSLGLLLEGKIYLMETQKELLRQGGRELLEDRIMEPRSKREYLGLLNLLNLSFNSFWTVNFLHNQYILVFSHLYIEMWFFSDHEIRTSPAVPAVVPARTTSCSSHFCKTNKPWNLQKETTIFPAPIWLHVAASADIIPLFHIIYLEHF